VIICTLIKSCIAKGKRVNIRVSRDLGCLSDVRTLAKKAEEAEKKIAFLTEQYGKLEAQLASKTSGGSGKNYYMTDQQYQLLLKVKSTLIEEQKEFEKMKEDGVALKAKNEELQAEVSKLREDLAYKSRTLEAVTLLAQQKQ